MALDSMQHDSHDDDLAGYDDVAGEVDVAPATYSSMRDQFRKQRERALAERTIDLDLPGYDGLVARYKVLSYDALNKIATKVSQDKRPRAELYGQASTLAQACVEMFGRADDGRLVPLAEVADDGTLDPIRFDSRLTEFLGAGVTQTAIGSVLAVLPDIRIPGHYVEYMDWHSGDAADVDGELEGEA